MTLEAVIFDVDGTLAVLSDLGDTDTAALRRWHAQATVAAA